MALDLCPEIEAEGKKWRFLGIQSKNCAEWYTTHLANMHQGITTVALFDQQGVEATKYIIGETELTTMAVEKNQILDLCQMKIKHLTGPLSMTD